MTINWHSLSQKELFKKLKSNFNGLSSQEAKERQKVFGFNELPSYRPPSSLRVFLSQFNSPLVYILLGAAILAFFMRDWLDVGIIVLVVLVNSFFGWIQENKSNQAMAKLKLLEVPRAKVFRDGRKIEIEAKELVLGDIIFIKSGDKIPADARILKSNNLQCSEASLTGESIPESKFAGNLPIGTSLGDRTNMVYSGTVAVSGWCEAVVCATGVNTEIGKIGKLVSEIKEEKTPLQKQLSQFSRFLSLTIVLVCLLVFIFGLYQGRDLWQMVIIAVALAVAAVPEGLLVAVTIILTVGMQAIFKKKALVRKLSAAEALGSISIICTDKTGTLTEGRMQIHKFVTAGREYLLPRHLEGDIVDKEKDLISKISVLCSNASIENPEATLEELRILGDPTEKALILGAIEAGHDPESLYQEYPRLDEIPFDSELKFMATANKHQGKGHIHIFAKGAPEKIISFCNQIMISGIKKKFTAVYHKELKKKIEEMTSQGLRVIACAYKTINKFNKIEDELHELVFIGFIALKDPLRTDAKETLEQCRSAGIRVVMVTGDHKFTAKAIFSELGIKVDSNVIEGQELDKLSDEQLDKILTKIDIFSRVEPHHKLRIIKAWQRRGEVVAMTGDGVNDSPALKAADVGIALGSGSDVAKETADLILLDDNFRVIVDAVRQGRIIFDNIRKVVLYLLVGAFSEIILITGAMFLGLPLPILAIQILWINLINSGFPNIALAFEGEEGDVMSMPPRSRFENILNQRMKFIIFGVGLVTDIIVLFLIYNFLRFYEINHLRTIVFAILGLDSLLYSFSIKSLRQSVLTTNIFTNNYLLAAVAISFSLLLMAISLPGFNILFKTVLLKPEDWSIVLMFSLIKLLFIEIAKKIPLPEINLKKINV